MASKFVQEATKQLAPVYQQSEQAISSQVPAIQNLYNTLIQGLQGQYDTQLQTGTKSIVEDASARGVLRSTLPVDARQALTTQLSQALLQGRAELGSRQAGDIANINEKLGTLRIQKAGGIADLARALETQDLDRQKFEYQKQLDAQQLAIERAKLNTGKPVDTGKGYSLTYKADGAGYAFTGPNKRPVSMADYAAATGTPMVDLLRQSQSKYDKNAYNAIVALQKGGKWNEDRISVYIAQKFPLLF